MSQRFTSPKILGIQSPTDTWRWCETNPQNGIFTKPCVFSLRTPDADDYHVQTRHGLWLWPSRYLHGGCDDKKVQFEKGGVDLPKKENTRLGACLNKWWRSMTQRQETHVDVKFQQPGMASSWCDPPKKWQIDHRDSRETSRQCFDGGKPLNTLLSIVDFHAYFIAMLDSSTP